MSRNEPDRTAPVWLLPGLYFFSRVMVFMTLAALRVEPVSAFGDQGEYFAMGRLPGWPFFDYWVEYPPLFAFANALIYRLALGNKTLFFMLCSLLLALSGAACLYFFERIAGRIFGPRQGFLRAVVLLALLIPLPYTWWTYDLLPLAFLLAGLDCLARGADWQAGLALGLGMLTKWFPGFALASALRYRPRRGFLRISAAALGLAGLALGGLWLASPVMTAASLASQPGRTSWQTVWAYLDGNRVTGHFIEADWRLDPTLAAAPRGNPPRIHPYLTLPVFALAGLFFFWRVKNTGERSLVAFVGITFGLFLLWSPGWSPQWMLYILPLVLLTLPFGQGLVLCAVLLVIALFEWPFALSQYWFRGTFAMAGLRTLAFALLVFLWQRITRRAEDPPLALRQCGGESQG